MKNHNVVFYISCALCICVGLTLGKLFNWGYFILDNKISILDALSIFTTIGLALYITNALEKQAQDRRVEKDLLLSKISEIEVKVDVLSDIIGKNSVDYYKLLSLLKSCNVSTLIIFKTIKDLDYKSFNKDSGIERKFKDNIHTTRQLTTRIPTLSSTGSEDEAISIENGTVKYSNARLIEIDSVLNEMKDNYFKLKFMINNE